MILFCAKLQPWKRPQDLLRAFAQSRLDIAPLIIAGEGPLRGALEALAVSLAISNRVRFIGFVNQTQLPGLYTSSDLLVLPSSYEAFGVVLNEASLCACAVLVSDQWAPPATWLCPFHPIWYIRVVMSWRFPPFSHSSVVIRSGSVCLGSRRNGT